VTRTWSYCDCIWVLLDHTSIGIISNNKEQKEWLRNSVLSFLTYFENCLLNWIQTCDSQIIYQSKSLSLYFLESFVFYRCKSIILCLIIHSENVLPNQICKETSYDISLPAMHFHARKAWKYWASSAIVSHFWTSWFIILWLYFTIDQSKVTYVFLAYFFLCNVSVNISKANLLRWQSNLDQSIEELSDIIKVTADLALPMILPFYSINRTYVGHLTSQARIE
jgi:hypothetical protein